MTGERDPRLLPISIDAATDDELMNAALHAAGSGQMPPIVLRGGRMVGLLRAGAEAGEESKVAFNAATIDEAIASGEPVVVGISSEFTGTFTPIDPIQALHQLYEREPDYLAELQRGMQQFPPQA